MSVICIQSFMSTPLLNVLLAEVGVVPSHAKTSRYANVMNLMMDDFSYLFSWIKMQFLIISAELEMTPLFNFICQGNLLIKLVASVETANYGGRF